LRIGNIIIVATREGVLYLTALLNAPSCRDNALVESFVATLKVALTNARAWPRRE
jgi:hypothetical protein